MATVLTLTGGHFWRRISFPITGLLHHERLDGIVLVDSAVRPPDFQWERDPRRSPIKPKRIYENFDEALSRFRLMPPQDCSNAYILDYIGRHSLKEVEGGWTWKFDDEMFNKCEFGDNMHEELDESVPFVGIPEAQHHVFLDQPMAFVSALRTMLAEWRHSKPDRLFS